MVKISGKLSKIEALRGIAALYVVIHHFRIGDGTWVSLFMMQGQMAVILFFVISGFVIRYATHKNLVEKGFGEYFKRRFVRIYPIFILALIISYICYAINQGSIVSVDLSTLSGNIFNLQDMPRHEGNWFSPFYSNGPLWSLSYEWWFYLLFFFIVKFIPRQKQNIYVFLLSIMGISSFWFYPNQASCFLSYFMIWWSGVILADDYIEQNVIRRQTISKLIVMLSTLASIYLVKSFFFTTNLDISYHPFIEFRHFCYAIFFIVVGYIWYLFSLKYFDFLFGKFAIMGSLSYALYVLHYPIMNLDLMKGISPFPLQFIVVLSISFAISYLAEHYYQPIFNVLIKKKA